MDADSHYQDSLSTRDGMTDEMVHRQCGDAGGAVIPVYKITRIYPFLFFQLTMILLFILLVVLYMKYKEKTTFLHILFYSNVFLYLAVEAFLMYGIYYICKDREEEIVIVGTAPLFLIVLIVCAVCYNYVSPVVIVVSIFFICTSMCSVFLLYCNDYTCTSMNGCTYKMCRSLGFERVVPV